MIKKQTCVASNTERRSITSNGEFPEGRTGWRLIWLCLGFALVFGVTDALAQTAPAFALGREEVPLLGKLVGLCFKAGGLAAVIGAGIRSRGKNSKGNGVATFVGAVGGIWTAYAFFGWPYVTHRESGFLGLTSYEVSEFSLGCLVGMAVLAVIGIVVCNLLANGGESGRKGS